MNPPRAACPASPSEVCAGPSPCLSLLPPPPLRARFCSSCTCNGSGRSCALPKSHFNHTQFYLNLFYLTMCLLVKALCWTFSNLLVFFMLYCSLCVYLHFNLLSSLIYLFNTLFPVFFIVVAVTASSGGINFYTHHI